MADGVKRRKLNQTVVETTKFTQTLIFSTKTTVEDENDDVRTQVEPKAIVHTNSKKADSYKEIFEALQEIYDDYSDENEKLSPG